VSGRLRDVVVVGGGPAGLALAAAAAQRGLDVVVVEARRFPVDQACGEGLLPAGVRALEALGARAGLAGTEATPIPALRWIDPAGAALELALPPPGGLGVRRTALSAALLRQARQAGAEIIEAEATSHHRGAEHVEVMTASGPLRGRLLVAADGRGSPIRRREELDGPVPRRPRFGIRRHLVVGPWTDAVEVHFAEGAEAYVTPAGAGRVGVAMLFERAAPGGWPTLLARFPALAARLAGATPASEDRGAGPLVRGSTAQVRDRLVLLGDAAGSVDPLSGEGVSSALAGALELAALLPGALVAGASGQALAGWERSWRRRHRRSVAWTALLLGLARRPALRYQVIRLGAARPWILDRLLSVAVG
jgi:flavin-dependent dehydrogenase